MLIIGVLAIAAAAASDHANVPARRRSATALQDIYFQLAIRGGRFGDAAESMSSAISASMRRAGAAEAIGYFCAALEAPAGRHGAVAALSALVGRIPPDELGLVDRRRLVLWFTMLEALDTAFEVANASLDHFASSSMIGTQWGMLWMWEMRPFRRDPRFQRLVARLRLSDYWQRHGPPDDEVLAIPTDTRFPASSR